MPAARQAWKQRGRDGVCIGGPAIRAIDVSSGSFTRANAAQRAILYMYCEVGHNMDLDGIAIIENGRIVSHIVFEGASNTAIGALPDINGNGLAEIVIATGGTNQGQSWAVISITEISGKETTDFGQAATYSDTLRRGREPLHRRSRTDFGETRQDARVLSREVRPEGRRLEEDRYARAAHFEGGRERI